MIKIDIAKCNKDYLCISECAYGFMYEKNKDGYPVINPVLLEKYCIKCWHCIAVCPKGAITSSEVKQEGFEKIKNQDFFSHDLLEKFIHTRRSFRTFKQKPVSDEIIIKWMDVTRWSPTASNSQQIKWILVKEKSKITHLTNLMGDWLKEKSEYPEIIEQCEQGNDILLRHTPHLLIATLPVDYFWAMTDAATAISYLELTAHSLGLGTCWAGYFTRAASEYSHLKKALKLSESQIVAGALMFGYPVYRFNKAPERKDINFL